MNLVSDLQHSSLFFEGGGIPGNHHFSTPVCCVISVIHVWAESSLGLIVRFVLIIARRNREFDLLESRGCSLIV